MCHQHLPEVRIWPFVALLTLLFTSTLTGQNKLDQLTDNLKQNVIAIKVVFTDGSEEKGFGFITGEQNGRLFLATAAHIVRGIDNDKTAKSIKVRFYNDFRWFDAMFIRHWDQEDLALLEIVKPAFVPWRQNCANLSAIGLNTKVRFIGLNDNEPNWVDPGLDGNIFQQNEQQFRFAIGTIRPGTSGAPLITERGIIGMVIKDEGNNFQALKLTQIRSLFSDSGQYPYFSLNSLSGVTPNRDNEIPLTKSVGEYYGRVVSSNNREYIPNLQITARNTYTGNVTRATTDYSGNYVLSLEHNTPYNINYAAPNFNDENRNVNVLNGTDITNLGILSMVPLSNTGTEIERAGFAILVSTVVTQPDLAKFSNLRSIASVYAKNEEGRYKIKVGNFPTREEAQRQLENVKRIGYPGAFIVTDDGVRYHSGNPDPGSTGNPSNTGTEIERAGFAILVSTKVTQPDLAKFSNLRSIASVYAKNEAGRYKIKVGNFPTREEAQRQLENVKNMGYPGAFIVTDDGVRYH